MLPAELVTESLLHEIWHPAWCWEREGLSLGDVSDASDQFCIIPSTFLNLEDEPPPLWETSQRLQRTTAPVFTLNPEARSQGSITKLGVWECEFEAKGCHLVALCLWASYVIFPPLFHVLRQLTSKEKVGIIQAKNKQDGGKSIPVRRNSKCKSPVEV